MPVTDVDIVDCLFVLEIYKDFATFRFECFRSVRLFHLRAGKRCRNPKAGVWRKAIRIWGGSEAFTGGMTNSHNSTRFARREQWDTRKSTQKSCDPRLQIYGKHAFRHLGQVGAFVVAVIGYFQTIVHLFLGDSPARSPSRSDSIFFIVHAHLLNINAVARYTR